MHHVYSDPVRGSDYRHDIALATGEQRTRMVSFRISLLESPAEEVQAGAFGHGIVVVVHGLLGVDVGRTTCRNAATSASHKITHISHLKQFNMRTEQTVIDPSGQEVTGKQSKIFSAARGWSASSGTFCSTSPSDSSSLILPSHWTRVDRSDVFSLASPIRRAKSVFPAVSHGNSRGQNGWTTPDLAELDNATQRPRLQQLSGS